MVLCMDVVCRIFEHEFVFTSFAVNGIMRFMSEYLISKCENELLKVDVCSYFLEDVYVLLSSMIKCCSSMFY